MGSNILPFEYDFDFAKLVNLKQTAKDTTNPKIEIKLQCLIPELPANATKMQVLHFISRFYQASRIMKWTDGTVLFNMFPQHLAGPLDQQWWDLTSANAANQDAATFHSVVNAFVLYKIEHPHAYDHHRDFLEKLKKPAHMTVNEFVSLLAFHNSILPLLPGSPSTDPVNQLPPKIINKIIFKAMPQAWQVNFLNANLDWTTQSTQSITTYMALQSERDPPRSTKPNDSNGNGNNGSNNRNNGNRNGNNNGNGNRNNNNGRNNSNNNNRRGNNNRNNNGNRNGNNRNNSNGNQQRTQDSDPCPLAGHAGHTWGNCFQNASNPNRNNLPTTTIATTTPTGTTTPMETAETPM